MICKMRTVVKNWQCFTRNPNFTRRRACASKRLLSTGLWEKGKKGLMNLLTEQQRSLLAEQKMLSIQVTDLAKKVGGVNLQHCTTSPFLQEILTPNADNDATSLSNRTDSEEVLDSTFAVVIAGEFNAGKSTLINALLGNKILETGPLPTTDCITVLAHDHEIDVNSSELPSRNEASQSKEIVATTAHSNAIILYRVKNLSLLYDLTLIDTPGTNAVMSNHTKRTLKLLPSADLILFVTSADRPFPESERQLLQSIQSYRKNIVIIINKMDLLDASGGNHGEAQKKKMLDFVTNNAADLLGARAVVMPVSAKDALAAKMVGTQEQRQEQLWMRSNFSTLESFLQDILTQDEKIKAKLLNPLGVTEGMLNECSDILSSRKKNLQTDEATLNLLMSQMNAWTSELENDLATHFQSNVKEVLTREMDRCRTLVNEIGFFERYTLFLMGDSTKFDEKWYSTRSITASNDIQKELLDVIGEWSTSLATSSKSQGQAVIQYLGKRPHVVGQNIIGSVQSASSFEDTQKRLDEKLDSALKNVLSSYNSDSEKNIIFRTLKNFTYVSSASNILALCSGIATVFETVSTIPGAATTCTFAAIGIGAVPYGNRQATKQYEKKWQQKNKKLASLEAVCAKEIQALNQRIMQGISPYTRYVKGERDDIASLGEECETLLSSTQVLRNRVLKI